MNVSGKLLDAFRRDDDVAHADLGPLVTSATQPPPFLAFELANGNHAAFSVQYLISIRFDPSEGIRLYFTTNEVLVTGFRLWPLYVALIEHRVARVKEASANEKGVDEGVKARDEDTPFIRSINPNADA